MGVEQFPRLRFKSSRTSETEPMARRRSQATCLTRQKPRPCGFCKGGALRNLRPVTDDLDIGSRRLDSAPMPWGLNRYYGTGHLHFITCSCYHRLPLLGKPGRRTWFLELLEQTRQRYDFVVVGYVVMPEHFHILIGEPEIGTPSTVLQVVKQRFARRVLRALRQRKCKAQPALWREDENHWVTFGKPASMISTCGRGASRSKSCATCMRIRSSGAWCWSPDSGCGAVSETTLKIIPNQ